MNLHSLYLDKEDNWTRANTFCDTQPENVPKDYCFKCASNWDLKNPRYNAGGCKYKVEGCIIP